MGTWDLRESPLGLYHGRSGECGLIISRQAPDIPASDYGYNLKLNIDVVLPGTDDSGDPLAVEYVRMYMRAYDHWLGGLVDAIYIDPESIPTITETPTPSEVCPRFLGAGTA